VKEHATKKEIKSVNIICQTQKKGNQSQEREKTKIKVDSPSARSRTSSELSSVGFAAGRGKIRKGKNMVGGLEEKRQRELFNTSHQTGRLR